MNQYAHRSPARSRNAHLFQEAFPQVRAEAFPLVYAETEVRSVLQTLMVSPLCLELPVTVLPSSGGHLSMQHLMLV